jgi:hypothetical protein
MAERRAVLGFGFSPRASSAAWTNQKKSKLTISTIGAGRVSLASEVGFLRRNYCKLVF